jgi:hypothetical protein
MSSRRGVRRSVFGRKGGRSSEELRRLVTASSLATPVARDGGPNDSLRQQGSAFGAVFESTANILNRQRKP